MITLSQRKLRASKKTFCADSQFTVIVLLYAYSIISSAVLCGRGNFAWQLQNDQPFLKTHPIEMEIALVAAFIENPLKTIKPSTHNGTMGSNYLTTRHLCRKKLCQCWRFTFIWTSRRMFRLRKSASFAHRFSSVKASVNVSGCSSSCSSSAAAMVSRKCVGKKNWIEC